MAPRYEGHDGLRQFTRDWNSGWADLRWQVKDIIDLGDRVLVRVNVHGRGPASGADVSMDGGYAIHNRRGLITRIDTYWNWAELVEVEGVPAWDRVN